jgi:hypothetical protein
VRASSASEKGRNFKRNDEVEIENLKRKSGCGLACGLLLLPEGNFIRGRMERTEHLFECDEYS